MALLTNSHERAPLIAAVRQAKFDVIVIEDSSRLWRNRAEFGPRSAELEDFGVHWSSCVGQDTRRDGWGLVVQVPQAIAEFSDGSSWVMLGNVALGLAANTMLNAFKAS